MPALSNIASETLDTLTSFYSSGSKNNSDSIYLSDMPNWYLEPKKQKAPELTMEVPIYADRFDDTEHDDLYRSAEAPIINELTEAQVLSVYPLQEWEGYVTEIREGSFFARLKDITNESFTDEIVEFDFSELEESELKKLKVGAIFRWVIGHGRKHGKKYIGQRFNYSKIVFRDLASVTPQDIEEANQYAEEIETAFNSNS